MTLSDRRSRRAELAAGVRAVSIDAWRLFEHNPLLMLLVLLVLGGFDEGVARLGLALDTYLFVSRSFLEAGLFDMLTRVFLCVLASLSACLIALKAEVDRRNSAGERPLEWSLRQFLWRSVLYWVVIFVGSAVVQALVRALLRALTLGVFFRQYRVAEIALSFTGSLIYAIVSAYLSAIILRRLPEATLRDRSERLAARERGELLFACVAFFCATAIVATVSRMSLAWHFMYVGAFRISLIEITLNSLFATLAAFVEYRRAMTTDPDVALVFD